MARNNVPRFNHTHALSLLLNICGDDLLTAIVYDGNIPRLARTCTDLLRRLAEDYEIARENFIDQKWKEEKRMTKAVYLQELRAIKRHFGLPTDTDTDTYSDTNTDSVTY